MVSEGSKPFPDISDVIKQELTGPCRKKYKITILNNINTIFLPGKSYLILGPPNSGYNYPK